MAQLPDRITHHQVREALAVLGLTGCKVLSLVSEPGSVTVTARQTDTNGDYVRYGGSLATVTVTYTYNLGDKPQHYEWPATG